MRQTDVRECEMALRVIDEYLTEGRSLMSMIGDLRGIIVLLSENESDLSRSLRNKWRILEETKARMIYKRLPSVTQEGRASISAALGEMKAIILGALQECVERL
jgi:hypothetical protein